MNCPFCDNECQEHTNQWGRLIYVCKQDDHVYETTFDAVEGITEALQIGDKIYYGHSVQGKKK